MSEFTGNLPYFAVGQPDLAHEVMGLPAERSYSLLDQTLDDNDVLRYATCVARTNHGGRYSDELFILSSHLDPAKEQPHDEVVEELSRLLPLNRYSLLGGREHIKHSPLGALQLHSSGDNSTLVTPIYDNGNWLVQSVVAGYSPEDELEVADRVFKDHVFVLNALVASITNRSHIGVTNHETAEGLVVPEFLYLSSPDRSPIVVQPIAKTPVPELPPPQPVDHFERFVGIDHIVDEFKSVVKLADVDPEARKRFGFEPVQTILLSGPSGTGKTHIARAFAEALHARIEEIELQDIGATHVSEWANNIGRKFDDAKSANGRVVLFFDEADGLMKSGNSGVDLNIMSVLKKQLENVSDHPNLFVVFATNDESIMPPELRARKRMHRIIRVPRPSSEEQVAIFRYFLFERPLAGTEVQATTDTDVVGYNFALPVEFLEAAEKCNIRELTKEAEGFTAGDIKSVFDEINQRRFLNSNGDMRAMQQPYTQDEVISALRRTRGTREA